MRIYIIGTQRSGTNLMRLILDTHRDLVAFGEEVAYWALENRVPDATLFERGIQRAQGEVLPRATGEWEKITYVSKEPKHFAFCLPAWTELFVEYDCIKEKADEGRFLFMLRHPFQVIGSAYGKALSNPVTGESTFAKELLQGMEQWKKDGARRFYSKYAKFLDMPQDEYWQMRWMAAWWAYKNEFLFDMMESKRYKLMPVEYSTLVTYPIPTIYNVVNFLGLDWSENFLMHHKQPHFGEINHVVSGMTRADRPVDRTSLQLWKEVLSPSQLEVIWEVAGETAERLGYIWE